MLSFCCPGPWTSWLATIVFYQRSRKLFGGLVYGWLGLYMGWDEDDFILLQKDTARAGVFVKQQIVRVMMKGGPRADQGASLIWCLRRTMQP